MKKKLREQIFPIRLTEEERALIEQAALKMGRTTGGYIRHVSLLNSLWVMEEDGTGKRLSKELEALRASNEDWFQAIREYVKLKRAS